MATSGKFGESVNEDYLAKLQQSAVAEKTRKQTRWALSRWSAWVDNRNRLNEGSSSRIPDLADMSDEALSYWLQRFIAEIRKANGDSDPPDSLYALVLGIQHHLRTELHTYDWDFFQQRSFVELKTTLDAEMNRLSDKGLGSSKKQATPISEDEEELL